jgi:hypothetical protein
MSVLLTKHQGTLSTVIVSVLRDALLLYRVVNSA